MKKTIILLVLLLSSVFLFAQEETIDNRLRVKGDIILQGSQIPSTFGEYGRKLYFGNPYENTDDMWIARFNVAADVSELRLNLGDYIGDRLIIGSHNPSTTFTPLFAVHTNGYVSVGNINNPGIKLFTNGNIYSNSLDVNGTIRSKEVKIEATGWSDFVFDKNYKLPTLKEVESHIKEYNHLPDIPSEKEIMNNGVNVVEMQAKLLQKIEELTLYVIEQEKTIKRLEQENKKQNILIDELLDNKK